ncbi:MAG: aminomethyl-transferring glycine dehydrogenase subunit GcvPA [Candidatus Omnitrophica bacterium]|nr:aminomethyl-transferring glycine dehydrogenase subunit GcvPA [Candidatus Omnitrophota bacterium]
MLRVIGVKDFGDLLSGIPRDLRLREFNIGPGMSEMDLLISLRRIGQRNFHSDRFASFLGAGAYDHYIPPVVGQLSSRSEFLTAYTPYQGEASQGTLQTIYEYQSLMCNLLAMDVSNASVYDGASAAAEAVVLALRHTSRPRVLVPETLHPETIETLKTYAGNLPVEFVLLPQKDGVTDLDILEKQADGRTAAVVLQNPNFMGFLEDVSRASEIARKAGALMIVSVNPLSLGVLEAPGVLGADIAVGDGQPLGNPVSYGGPHFGFFAVKEPLMRRLPGRISGMTVDNKGRRAFVLTLQAREQHIRREKATSNICTNHALSALKALIFLTVIGPHGFKRMAELNVQKSHETLDILKSVPGVKPYSAAPFFNEFTVRIDKDDEKLKRAFFAQKLIGPLHLGRFDERWRGLYLVAVTEQRTTDEMERLARAIRDA